MHNLKSNVIRLKKFSVIIILTFYSSFATLITAALTYYLNSGDDKMTS
jgi:hypothetical protein